MEAKSLMSDLKRVKRVFPSLDFGNNNGGWMIISDYHLPRRYNRGRTKILFRLFLGRPYHEPHIYVPTKLDLLNGHSDHLGYATEPEMKKKGWKRLCINMNWRPSHSLLDAVHLAMDFLNNLRG
jgi:hypothetical protein